MNMNDELKESLCNHLAVAGVENVISKDATEIWTLLDLPSPEKDFTSQKIELSGPPFCDGKKLPMINKVFKYNYL